MTSLDPAQVNRPEVLSGNYDVLLLNSCSLTCRDCCFLELPRLSFAYPKKFIWNTDDLFSKLTKYRQSRVIFEQLTLLGGEPTLHPNFSLIAHWLSERRGDYFQKLHVVSNMTLLVPETFRALICFDEVVFSVYPQTKTILSAMKETGLLAWLQDKVKVALWPVDEFEIYGVPDSSFKGSYNRCSNWSRCQYKGGCHVLSPEGISYCHVVYARGENFCRSMDIAALREYVLRLTPHLECADCPIPPTRRKWESRYPTRDNRATAKAIASIQQTAAAIL